MSDNILIVGASGYLGSAFVAECRRRGINHFHASRRKHQYDNPKGLNLLLKETQPTLVINCAAWIPTPSVDLCKQDPSRAISANTLLPKRLAMSTGLLGIPLMHLSTACLFDEHHEYTEGEAYTRDVNGYCGVYLHTKLAAELAVVDNPQHYILRLRLPFDEFDHPRNYLSKLASFERVFDHTNSLSHRGDFVKAALGLWQLKAAFGNYHVTNPGFVTAEQTIAMMMAHGIRKEFPYYEKGPACGCKLSTKKLTDAGVKIRPVMEALEEAVRNWKPQHV
jgi:dTDP-4-dehydrorhamnose reductase